MTDHKRSTKILGYLIIFSLFFILLLIASEFAFRFHPKFGRIGFQYDKHLIWRLNANLAAQKPYAQGQVAGKEPFTLRFNNNGFRGKKIKKEKREGIQRIMLLGDSYAAGLDYPDDEIFSSILEQKLNNDGGKFEVINISCPAWGTDQHYIYWKEEGRTYQPDYLIIAFSPNDMREMYNKKLVQLNQSEVQVNAVELPPTEKIGWYLGCRSSLFQYIQKKIILRNYGSFENLYYHYPVNYGIKDSTDWDAPIFLNDPFAEVVSTYQLFEHLLTEIQSDCLTLGTKLILVKLPIEVEFDGSYETAEHNPDKVSEMVDSISNKLNIPFLNLNEKLKEKEHPLDVFMSWEYHYNSLGHQFIGGEMYQFMKDDILK
jgi:hypothetical protein